MQNAAVIKFSQSVLGILPATIIVFRGRGIFLEVVRNKFWGQLLTILPHAYRNTIAAEMVFVRLGEGKTQIANSGATCLYRPPRLSAWSVRALFQFKGKVRVLQSKLNF